MIFLIYQIAQNCLHYLGLHNLSDIADNQCFNIFCSVILTTPKYNMVLCNYAIRYNIEFEDICPRSKDRIKNHAATSKEASICLQHKAEGMRMRLNRLLFQLTNVKGQHQVMCRKTVSQHRAGCSLSQSLYLCRVGLTT